MKKFTSPPLIDQNDHIDENGEGYARNDSDIQPKESNDFHSTPFACDLVNKA